MRVIVGVVCVWLLAVSSAGAQTCEGFRSCATGDCNVCYGGVSAVASAAASFQTAQSATYNYVYEGSSTASGFYLARYNKSGGAFAGNAFFSMASCTLECVNDCEDMEGGQYDASYSGSTAESALCDIGLECQADAFGVGVCLGGTCFAHYEYTGLECTTGTSQSELMDLVVKDSPAASAQSCINSGGLAICSTPGGENCGTLNGEQICLDAVPAGNCVFLGDGGMVCADDAGAPPAPTDVTGMAPATPDGSFSGSLDGSNRADDGPGDTYNYFGPGTVAGSGTPTSGSGSGPGGSDGEDEGEDAPLCGEGECVGELPDLVDVANYDDSVEAFWARVEAAPLINTVADLGTSMPAGECPQPEMTLAFLGGATFTMDAHCSLWTELATVISAVMLAVWIFLGARIIASA